LTHPSAVRMCQLLCLLEQEGAMTTGEIAARLHVSSVTASHDAAALLASGLCVQGREATYGTRRDRKLRLCDGLHFLILHMSKQGIKSLSYCPATGTYTRRAVSLCDAIPMNESLLAAWRGVLSSEKETTKGRLGVILDDGTDLPDAVARELNGRPTDTRAALVDAAIRRQYPDRSVLYLRYGERPTVRMFFGGVAISTLRLQDELFHTWGEKSDERISQMAGQIVRVNSLLALDTVLLETDGADVGAVCKGLEVALANEGEAHPPIVAVEGLSLCEREMLERLRMCLAEKILSETKEAKKSPIER